MKNIYTVFLLAIITLSCNKNFDSQLLDVAEMQRQIELNPDSVANILEEMIDPAALSDEDKANYWYLLTLSHVQQGRSLINDSLIHFSVEYYKAINSPYLSSAYRLAAYQINWQGNKTLEQEGFLLKSLEAVENTDDTIEIVETLDALAYYYVYAKEPSKAIGVHERIIELSPSSRAIAMSTAAIGVEYAMLGVKDSCATYFDNAIAIAKNGNNQSLLYDMLRGYADCLNSLGDSKKALNIINQANQLNGCFNNEYYLNFTRLNALLNLDQLDSAKVYLDYLQKNDSNISPTDVSYFYANYVTIMLQSLYNEKKGLPAEILSMALHGDNTMDVISNNLRADKERIFTQNKLSKEKDKLEIGKAQQLQVYLLIIIALLLITGVVIYLYQRKVLQKERALQ